MLVLFLDRDGTLIEEPTDEVVSSFDKVTLYPEIHRAFKLLVKEPYMAFIVTNQKAIASGDMSERRFRAINQHVVDLLAAEGAYITKTYYCPHGQSLRCSCWKPQPTMINDACREYHCRVASCFVIGDRESDMDMGRAAGARTVRVARQEEAPNSSADYVAHDLVDAFQWVAAQ